MIVTNPFQEHNPEKTKRDRLYDNRMAPPK